MALHIFEVEKILSLYIKCDLNRIFNFNTVTSNMQWKKYNVYIFSDCVNNVVTSNLVLTIFKVIQVRLSFVPTLLKLESKSYG